MGIPFFPQQLVCLFIYFFASDLEIKNLKNVTLKKKSIYRAYLIGPTTKSGLEILYEDPKEDAQSDIMSVFSDSTDEHRKLIQTGSNQVRIEVSLTIFSK